MVKSAGTKLFDNAVADQIAMERLAESMGNKTVQKITRLRKDLIREIVKIDPTSPKLTRFKKARIQKLNKVARDMIIQTYNDIAREHRRELADAGMVEQEFDINSLNEVVGVDLVGPTLDTKLLLGIVDGLDVQGLTPKEWWNKQKVNREFDFRREINVGVASGETIGQITKRFKPKGGWTRKARTEAITQVRTNVNSIMNEVRLKTYEQNADMINTVEHVSTLDSKTSQICISRDGLVWKFPSYKPVGHDKQFISPPLHFRCRSTISPGLKSFDEIFGLKPKKGGKPIDAEAVYMRKLRDKIPQREGETTEQYNARLGRFAKKARSSIDGPVTEGKTMADFLKRNPSRAVRMLGKGKADLFLKGKINLKQLTDQTGRPLTLKQIKENLKRKRK